MPGIEDILLAYGPLGVMTLGAGWISWFLWKEIQKRDQRIREMQKAVTDTILEAKQRECNLLREMAESEVSDKEQYMRLCQEMQTALENLGERLDYATGIRRDGIRNTS